jgi:hypothetical protein
MFWTDENQARERLSGTVVNYNGHPTYIDHVALSKDQGVVAVAERLGKGVNEVIPLDNEKWNNFRDLPKLGWFNYVGYDKTINPVFSERRAVNSRSHGLTTNNTRFFRTSGNGLERDRHNNLKDYFGNQGYLETANSDEAFPKLSEALMSLGDEPSGVAFSRKFCVVVTEEGMKWLLRKNKRIGFFTGTDSLNLFPKLGFYREELVAVPTFDINNIKEF